MSFPRYPKYKDSGVEWLGQVPEHWDRVRVKNIFALGRGRVISLEEVREEGDYPVFSSQTTNAGCLGYIETFDFDCDQLTWTTDGANAGTVFLRSGKHNCTNVCGTLQIKRDANFDLHFGLHFLTFATQFYKRPDTNGAKIMNGEMAEIILNLPPLAEQRRIAEFLDRETGKIDALVAEQQRLMALLKEKRQAVISHAVTKGLQPNAPMKPSGIEWLGDVPAHWRIAPLRWYAKCCSGDGLSSNEVESLEDEEHSVRVIGGNGLMGYTSKGNIEHSVMAVGRVGALCGNIHIVKPPAWITDNSLILDPDSNVFDLQFLSLVLRSRNLNNIASRTAQPLITGTQVSDQRIPSPPLNEQQQITAILVHESAKFDTLTAEAQRAIDLLQERRTALISAAVTGQIDVRKATA